jgi:plastocyanin
VDQKRVLHLEGRVWHALYSMRLPKEKMNMKRMKWVAVLSTTILSTVAIMAINSPNLAVRADSKPTLGTEVKIDNFSFGPDLTIAAGTTITWTNHDDVPHVVASDTNIFKSKVLDTDDRYSYTFAKPGTYLYYCTVHPKMTAKVVVQ